jgi:DivIVA domain-containing protein
VVGHIFVSYSRTDEAYVQRLIATMRQARLDVWVDQELGRADRWLAIIRNKIDTCSALVVVMTPAAERSEMVEAELLHARDAGKEVYALLLEGKPFWYLRHRQYESVEGGQLPSADWIRQLTAAVAATTPAAQSTPASAPVAAVEVQATIKSPQASRPTIGMTRRQALARDVDNAQFRKPAIGRRGYDEQEVDVFLDHVILALETGSSLNAAEVHNVAFKKPPIGKRGYDEEEVDEFLDHIETEVAAIMADEESNPPRPSSGAIR